MILVGVELRLNLTPSALLPGPSQNRVRDRSRKEKDRISSGRDLCISEIRNQTCCLRPCFFQDTQHTDDATFPTNSFSGITTSTT